MSWHRPAPTIRHCLPWMALAALTLALGGLGLGARHASAQVAGVTFTGTVRDSINAPPPVGTPLLLVVGPPLTPAPQPPPPHCAAGTTDAQGNFSLLLQPFVRLCSQPGTVLSLLVGSVYARESVNVPSTGGVYTVNFTVPVPLGGQPLPAASPVLPLLQPPPQATPAPLARTLSAGCNLVAVSLGTGATPLQLALTLSAPSLLTAIWRYDPIAQRYAGFFPNPAAPSDLVALAPVDAVYICVAAPVSFSAP